MNNKFDKLELLLKEKSITVSVAESCTGGNLSSLLTRNSGLSDYIDRGYITYSNEAKINMLGVSPNTINDFGAVSEQTATQMVQGVINNSSSSVAVAVTGIAGPTGGSILKPVGMVCFGFCILGAYFSTTEYFSGNRAQVITSSVDFVVDTLINELS
jgi:nicotinamide-nucleotide amidase